MKQNSRIRKTDKTGNFNFCSIMLFHFQKETFETFYRSDRIECLLKFFKYFLNWQKQENNYSNYSWQLPRILSKFAMIFSLLPTRHLCMLKIDSKTLRVCFDSCSAATNGILKCKTTVVTTDHHQSQIVNYGSRDILSTANVIM